MTEAAHGPDAAPDPHRLLALLHDDNIDAAIEAGLMRFSAGMAGAALDSDGLATILAAQQRLSAAWQARERFRARALRLARIERKRAARRTPPPESVATKPALPPAAADALARARAKAAGTP